MAKGDWNIQAASKVRETGRDLYPVVKSGKLTCPVLFIYVAQLRNKGKLFNFVCCIAIVPDCLSVNTTVAMTARRSLESFHYSVTCGKGKQDADICGTAESIT